MVARFSPILPGAVAAAAIMIAWNIADERGLIVTKVSAFQTPIIFPLLWMAKRLTHNRIGVCSPFPPMPTPLSVLKSITAINRDGSQTSRSDGDTKIEEMVEWLDSEFDAGSTSTSSIKIDSNDQGLRGIYATKDIKKNGILIEIPYDAALLVGDSLWGTIFDDFTNVPNSENWSEDDIDDVYQGLNFIQSFMTDSGYAPYTQNLPTLPNSGSGDEEAGLTPDFWSNEYISGLGVPSYVQQILDRKQIVTEVAKKNKVNENELRWATWMIRSRRFTTWNMVNDDNYNEDDDSLFGVFPVMRKKKIEQIQGFLFPLIDMANHAFDPNAILKISVNRWTREFDDTSTFALRALKPIRKGDEVTIEYGDGSMTSLDFMDKYGFFLEGNAADKTIDWGELQPEFTTSLEEDQAELTMMLEQNTSHGSSKGGRAAALSKTTNTLKTIVSKIQDYEPSFASKLDNGLHLVGSGMRQKMGIKIYAVAMYGSPVVLDSAASRHDLRNAARTFDMSSSPSRTTTFVLEMILQADAETIAEAIADSVQLRYDGPHADVQYLKSLIVEGVKESGGQATKGSVLQFDCTEEGVSVIVDGASQGTAKDTWLGSAFVDVFLDENTVSPSLVENCLGRGGSAKLEGHAVEASHNNMAGKQRRGPESKRTMLSIRVLMKRLSNWKPKASTAVPTIADENVLHGEQMQQEEEVPNNDVGSDSLETSADVTDDISSVEEIEIASYIDEDVELIEPDLSDEMSHVEEMEITAPVDEEVELLELVLPESAPISAGETALEEVDTLESDPIIEAEKGTEEIVPITLPSAGKGVALEDATAFNANSVEARIQLLEAEIEAEIARVKSQGAEQTVETPATQDATSIAVNPVSDSTNEIAVQDETVDKQAALEEEARLKKSEEEKERQSAVEEAAEKAARAAEAQQRYTAVESKMKSLKDKATGVEFDPKLDDGLYLVGVGVRKKAIINIYAVAMYSGVPTIEALLPFPRGKQKKEAQSALRDAARNFGPSSPITTLVLEMVFKVDAQTIASAIAEGVKPRYSGSASDVKELETLIIEGVKSKGGQATKGTIFRFDCTNDGVKVSVDGNEQGVASFEGMGSAFVDVFTDDKAVSQQLVDSCIATWCGSGLRL